MESRDELSRTQEIVDVIISGINQGTFTLGERLPSQRDMADLFGASRTVIREAIKILEGRRIVQSRKGSGIYICGMPDELSNLAQADTGYFELNLQQALEFGFMLWHESIRLIAKRAVDDEIEILERTTTLFWERSKRKTSIQERYIHETSYGLILAKYSHNPLIYRITTELFEVLSEIDYKVVADGGKYKEILELDLKTVEALRERNAVRALFLDCERIRLIKKILAGESELLNAPCKIKPILSQAMQPDS